MRIKFITLLLTLSLTACGHVVTSNSLMEMKSEAVVKPEPGKALFIFHANSPASPVWLTSTIWDITDRRADPKLVSNLSSGMRSAYHVPPGEYDFMVLYLGYHEVMKAHVEADKTYFVLVDTVSRAFKHAYKQFIPLGIGEKNEITATDVSVFKADIDEWYKDNLPSAIEHREKAYRSWEGWSAEERAKRTMDEEDGR